MSHAIDLNPISLSPEISSRPVPLRTAYIVVALGFGAMAFEGYDLIVFGSVVPALLAYHPWALTPNKVGLMGSVALFGMFLGAPAAGWLTDRFGRRRLFIGLLSFFSLMMLCSAFAPTPTLFMLFRFLAGLGFGGIPPTAIAQAFEFSPPKRKVFFNAVMLSGFGIGGILAGGLALALLKHIGFRGLFAVGFLPLLTLVPLAAWLLPESSGLATESRPQTVAPPSRSPWAGVLQGRAGVATGLFSVANFCSLLFSFGLTTWLPQLMRGAGYDLGSALQFLLLLTTGGLVGAICGGWLADRMGSRRIATIMFLAAAVAVGLLLIPAAPIVTRLLVFLIGAAGLGNQSILFGYMAGYYRQASRATALGAASGIGRLGAASGPLVGGLLITAGAGLFGNLFVFAAAAAMAGVATLLVPSPVQGPSNSGDRQRAALPLT